MTSFDSFAKQFTSIREVEVCRTVTCYGSLSDKCFKDSCIERVVINEVTIIPYQAFYNCSKLSHVDFPDATAINTMCFMLCSSLKAISLPSLKIINGDFIFAECTKLKTVEFDALEVVDSSYSSLFKGCKLNTISLPNTPPSVFNKKVFDGMYLKLILPSDSDLKVYDNNTDVEGDVENDSKWCGINLIQIYVRCRINNRLCDAETVEEAVLKLKIGYSSVSSICIETGLLKLHDIYRFSLMFSNIHEIEVLEAVEMDSTELTQSIFEKFKALVNISIHQNVSIRQKAFYGLSTLVSAKFSSVDFIEDSAFKNCVSLNVLEIPNCKVLVGDSVFMNCISLEEINLESLTTVSPESTKLFQNCSNLKVIHMPQNPPQTFNRATFSSLSAVIHLPDERDYITYDDNTSVEGDKMKDLMWCGVFFDIKYFSHASTFIINNEKYSRRRLSAAIEEIDKAKSIEIIEGIVESDDLFAALATYNSALSLETFIAREKTLTEIRDKTFERCKNLRTIIIEDDVLIGSALKNITSLTSLTMTKQVSLPEDAFKGTENLKSANLPLIRVVSSSLFSNKTKLETVVLSSAVILHDSAFSRCSSLHNLTMNNICIIYGDSHFEECSSIKALSFKQLSRVEESSVKMFSGCKNLKTIELGDFPPVQFNENAFQIADDKTPSIIFGSNESCKENYIPLAKETDGKYVWKGITVSTIENSNQDTGPMYSGVFVASGILISIAVSAILTIIAIYVLFKKNICSFVIKSSEDEKDESDDDMIVYGGL